MSTAPPNSSKPTTGQPVAASYNVTPPVLVDGQATTLQVDVNGNLKTTSSGGGSTGNVNITGINGNPPAITNPLPVELSDGTNPLGTVGNPLNVTGTGTNASVGTNGAVAPASSTQIGGSDGADLQPLQVDGSKNLKVAVNAALPAGTNVLGGVELVDSAGTNKASISAAGALKVDGSGATQPISGTVTANAGTGTFGVQQTSLPADLIATGTISANAANVAIPTNGANSVVFNVTGTWSGTLQPQYQLADGSWVNGSVFPTLPSGLSVPTITANGQWKTDVGGFKGFRLLSTAWASGSAIVSLEAATQSTFITTLMKGSAGAVLDGTAGSPSTGVVTVQGVASGTPVQTQDGALPVDLTATGNLTGAGQSVAIATNGAGVVVFNITGTWSGILVPQVQLPDSSWISTGAFPTSALGSAQGQAFTANGQWKVDVSGYKGFRVSAISVSSGTAVVTLEASQRSDQTITAALAAQSQEVNVSWTNATAGNTALTVPVQGFNTVTVFVNQGTTITGGVLTFEVSDSAAFTNAYPVIAGNFSTAVNGSSQFGSTYTLTANTNQAFVINVAGWTNFRVRLSTVISGTATVAIGVVAAAAGPSIVSVNEVNAINTVNTVTTVSTVASLTTGNIRSLSAAAAVADNDLNVNFLASSTSTSNPTYIGNSNYGGAFSGAADAVRQGWSKARTSTVFKTASVSAATTGNSAVWTPVTGNKFRLLGFQITAQGLAATASAAVTVSFQDATTGINFGTYDVDVPAVASVVSGVNQISGGAVNVGSFGILSAAANNVLNFNISAAGAGTVGTYRVTVWGTEE